MLTKHVRRKGGASAALLRRRDDMSGIPKARHEMSDIFSTARKLGMLDRNGIPRSPSRSRLTRVGYPSEGEWLAIAARGWARAGNGSQK